MVEAKRRAFPRDIDNWLRALKPVPTGSSYLLVAQFLSPRARTLLEQAGVNYIDMTGNILVRIKRPSVLVSRRKGATGTPHPRTGPCAPSGRKGRARRAGTL